MGFSGEYKNNMDAKGRVIFPVKFREAMDNTFIMTKGFDNNLLIYPKDKWEIMEEKLAALKITSKSARIVKRLLLGSAMEVEVDGQDRITVPQNLRTYANLTKEILFVGQADYIEVWSVDNYNEASECDYSEAAEEVDL
ncbi:MAG: division/cell wall cluster transcriptional repressor MraZ [Lachnospiraceae bacterium]|nr:division/cell wall cluster transcriptional repressor MraZ [Lachnospiraceae bacterium]